MSMMVCIYLHEYSNVSLGINMLKCIYRYDYGNPEFVHFSEQLSILIRGGGFQNHWIFVPLLTPMIFLSWVSSH